MDFHPGLLGNALFLKGKTGEALIQWRKVVLAQPNFVPALNEAAWVLATSRDASLRNGAEAIELAERAVELSKGAQARIIATLAASYAEAGEFPKAVAAARRAQEQAQRENNQQMAAGLNQMIVLYESKTAFRDGR